MGAQNLSQTSRDIASNMGAQESATRDRIIQATVRLCESRSLHEVTIREIYAAAGIRNGSAVRYYFGDKEGLGRAILETLDARIIEPAKRQLRQLEETSCDSPYTVEDVVAAILGPSIEVLDSPEFGWSAPRAFPRLMRDVEPETSEDFARSVRKLVRLTRDLLSPLLPDVAPLEIELRLAMTFTLAMHFIDDLFSIFGFKELPPGAQLEPLISAATDYMVAGLQGTR